MLRAALPQMGMHWYMSGDYARWNSLQNRDAAYPPLSRKAPCAFPARGTMYYQGKRTEAADLIALKSQRDEQAGDMTASDKQEMGWIVGIFYGDDRAEAIAGRPWPLNRAEIAPTMPFSTWPRASPDFPRRRWKRSWTRCQPTRCRPSRLKLSAIRQPRCRQRGHVISPRNKRSSASRPKIRRRDRQPGQFPRLPTPRDRR